MKKIITWVVGIVALFGIATYILNQQSQQKANDTTSTVSSEASSSVEVVSEESSESSSMSESETSSVAETSEKPSLNTTFEDSEGKVYELNDMFDKPILLNIWASWCPPCREEMPHFQAAYDKYGEEINFIMLNATMSQNSETKEKVQAFVEEIGLTVPVYYDIEFNNMLKFGANVLPTTVLINKEGKVIEIIRGMLTEETLEAAINKLKQ
ncbi:TlpA family protein disulfide reductase [Aerococcaceae bacterium NML180378]|nr:TlpA family protein disulfide reductase [Aerococcaceae bacterium NML180378]